MSDNTPVLVVDAGSASLKAGYAGEDSPATIIPSVAQKCPHGMESLEETVIAMNDFDTNKSLHPIRRGVVKNWEQLEVLWKLMLDDIGITATDSTSVLIAEPPKANVADRAKWAEMLFESFRVPSIYIANSASLALFAAGRTTGLVVECGGGVTSSVPVFEGLALEHASTSLDFGGQDISLSIQNALEERGIPVDAGYARLLKERLAYVNIDPNAAAPAEAEQSSFSLPDGTDVTVDRSLFGECSEQIFNNDKFEPAGLSAQVHESIHLCDETLMKDLSHNVVISGGTSLIPGFGDRLERDLTAMVARGSNRSQRHLNIRVIPSSNHREAGFTSQRKIAPWIGGSIVASLDTFKQMKITRQEWEEDPDACTRAKFV